MLLVYAFAALYGAWTLEADPIIARIRAQLGLALIAIALTIIYIVHLF